ncbi:MAG: hypothetical protein PHE59_00210 [Patescibacteria group bacterium]|nr:hypothetical protein [Patescibacteria group bacterium]MDD5534349.1 hypothetical protein [Patescibacteria group bacterium]
MKKIKKFLTEQFLEKLSGLKLFSKYLLLAPSVRPTLFNYQKLSEELIDEWDKKSIKKAIKHLIHSGLLKKNEKDEYFLTAKGMNKLLELKIKKKIETKQKIKKKYFVLIFDIPEKTRFRRDLFRRHLKELGFEQIQQSVWITQYDILEEIKVLIENFGLNKYIKFFVAEKV